MREIHGGFGARLWFGLVVLALGVLWTLDNLNILESEPVLQWWPVILIAYGLTRLLGLVARPRPVAGLVWLGIGAVLLAHNLGVVGWGIWELWPVLLILFGASITWRSLRGPGDGRMGRLRAAIESREPHAVVGEPPGADRFSSVAVWAGVDRKSTSQALRGGDFTAFMGGGEIDLRGARPVPEGAVVEVLVFMGGVDVIVPEDWRVENRVFALMGGVEDSRKVPAAHSEHTLVLKGFVMMGGVEIKN